MVISVTEVSQGFQGTGTIHKMTGDHTKTHPWLQAGMFENKQTFRSRKLQTLASNDLSKYPSKIKVLSKLPPGKNVVSEG